MLVGVTRVRNESLIFHDTLSHFERFCDELIVYDDCSSDNTAEIALDHGCRLIEGGTWRKDRVGENTRHRKLLFDAAVQAGADYVLVFDADERLEGYLPPLDGNAYTFRLFDGYMTPEMSKPYLNGPLEYLPRAWGPEYRDIIMLFPADPHQVFWNQPGMRQPNVAMPVVRSDVRVKHYGKCLSVQHWEETCDYYIRHFPQWRAKWWERKGKAIHTESDFQNPLFDWEDLPSVEVPLR